MASVKKRPRCEYINDDDSTKRVKLHRPHRNDPYLSPAAMTPFLNQCKDPSYEKVVRMSRFLFDTAVRLMREEEVKVCFLTIPEFGRTEDELNRIRLFNETIRTFCGTLYPFVEVCLSNQWKMLYTRDKCNLSQLGLHRWISYALARLNVIYKEWSCKFSINKKCSWERSGPPSHINTTMSKIMANLIRSERYSFANKNSSSIIPPSHVPERPSPKEDDFGDLLLSKNNPLKDIVIGEKNNIRGKISHWATGLIYKASFAVGRVILVGDENFLPLISPGSIGLTLPPGFMLDVIAVSIPGLAVSKVNIRFIQTSLQQHIIKKRDMVVWALGKNNCLAEPSTLIEKNGFFQMSNLVL